MRKFRLPGLRFRRDRRGMAAVEFALIAPALIVCSMGVFEMAFRFRASDEATRYAHEVADLVARQTTATSADLKEIYDSSVYMMKPLQTTANLDLDIQGIGYKNDTPKTPYLLWRRWTGAGGQVGLNLPDASGMGDVNESVIFVSIKYRYTSPITSMFGGRTASMVRTAYARPRETRMITMDGSMDDSAATTTKTF